MPHHFRMLLVVLAFPLAYIAGYSLYQLYLAHIHVATIAAADTTRIQHPTYHPAATRALRDFAALPAARQRDIRQALGKHLVDFEEWLSALAAAPPRLICVGEDHNDQTRQFLARSFFRKLQPDILMLESTDDELQRIRRDRRPYVPLLGADIVGILKAQSGMATVVGIDQRDTQTDMSREQAVLANLLQTLHPERQHLILFGALHCGDFDGWLYDLLGRSTLPFPSSQMTSLRVMGEHQDGSLEAFIYFLDEADLRHGSFTLTRPAHLPPWVIRAFPVLYDQTLSHYDAVAVFRP